MDYVEQLKVLDARWNPDYPINDIGVSRLFYDLHRDTRRYVTEAKSWYYFDGRRWDKDSDGLRTMELCKTFVQGYDGYIKAVCSGEDEGDKALLKFAAGLSARKKREGILKDAQSVEPVGLAAFDRNPLFLNCWNGTFDLRKMVLYPHRAEDFITKLSRAKYDPVAKCDRWERFISEIMSGDTATARYLQKALGYALSGDTSYECFFILHGSTTRNGKSTLTETISYILGDYARTVQPQTLSRRSSDGASPSPDMARLKGARLVNLPEPEKGLTLNVALIKQLTGGDTYTTRNLHENSFEFKPEFKIYINANHLPVVTDSTVFTSRRVKLIPFDRHFEPVEQDRGLKRFFRRPASMSGILNWLIEGYRLLGVEGLDDITPRMAAAIADYQLTNVAECDMGAFIAENLLPAEGGKVKTSALYERYRVRAKGGRILPIQAFFGELRKHVEIKHDYQLGNVVVGYTLKS